MVYHLTNSWYWTWLFNLKVQQPFFSMIYIFFCFACVGRRKRGENCHEGTVIAIVKSTGLVYIYICFCVCALGGWGSMKGGLKQGGPTLCLVTQWGYRGNPESIIFHEIMQGEPTPARRGWIGREKKDTDQKLGRKIVIFSFVKENLVLWMFFAGQKFWRTRRCNYIR